MSLEKIHSKFIKSWEIKNPLWDQVRKRRQRNHVTPSETMTWEVWETASAFLFKLFSTYTLDLLIFFGHISDLAQRNAFSMFIAIGLWETMLFHLLIFNALSHIITSYLFLIIYLYSKNWGSPLWWFLRQLLKDLPIEIDIKQLPAPLDIGRI